MSIVAMERLLLIEDDHALGRQVVGSLRAAGFEARWWQHGRELYGPSFPEVALIILDLMLPEIPGLELLAHIRQRSDVPVLVLSARTDSVDKVRALQLGADDYMTKPYWPQELIERIKARLRRPLLAHSQIIRCGPLILDTFAHTAQIDGHQLQLTKLEFRILHALIRRKGNAVARQWLVDELLEPGHDSGERRLDAHVSRLRRKLAEHGARELLVTVWGIGYRLQAEEA